MTAWKDSDLEYNNVKYMYSGEIGSHGGATVRVNVYKSARPWKYSDI